MTGARRTASGIRGLGADVVDPSARVVPRAVPRVLSIAGSDPSGGAGALADVKTVSVLGGYGMAAITAVVPQNTTGVSAVHDLPAAQVREQLEAISADIAVDAVKIGMLGSAENVQAVHEWVVRTRPPFLVLDPVRASTGGVSLLDPAAGGPLVSLLAAADLITPNLPELAWLVGGEPAVTGEQAREQAMRLADALGSAVLVTGGHFEHGRTPDVLQLPGRPEPSLTLDGPRIGTSHGHGTGCSYSSAIAVLTARTGDLPEALELARAWLRGALRRAQELEVGRGRGPLHHGHHLPPVADLMAAAALPEDRAPEADVRPLHPPRA